MPTEITSINGTPPILNPIERSICQAVSYPCLDELIGIRGCVGNNCARHYLDDIGFTQEQLANILSLEDETAISKLLANVMKIAKERVVNDVFRKGEVRVAERISNCLVGEFEQIVMNGNVIDDKYFTPNIAEGVRIQNTYYNQLKLRINSITIDTETAVTQGFLIVDGNYTYYYEADTVAGRPTTININALFESRYIYVLIADTNSRIRATKPYADNRNNGSCSACHCGDGCSFVGWKQNTGESNTATTYGIKIDYDLVCDIETIVCNFKYDLAELLLYAVAKELSERHNISMRLNSESLDERKNDYRTQMYDKKYTACYEAIKPKINRELKNYCPECINCYGNKRTTAIL